MLSRHFRQAWVRVFPSRAAKPAPDPTADTAAAGAEPAAGQALFVIGAARSGTTILQNALNDADGIFLFGEPRFHADAGQPDFAARYNAMHRSWGNQQNKSSYCPPLFEGDAPWQAYMARLAESYRYVGAKIVVNPEQAIEEAQRIFAFHCRHFYRAHYLFTFRHPLDVLMSTRGLAQLGGQPAQDYAPLLRGFFSVVQLYLRMLRNLPNVHAVFHETMGEPAFERLSRALGLPLQRSSRYYDQRKVRRYELNEVAAAWRPLVVAAIALYEDFRREASAGFELIQIEQNNGQLDPHHYTPLGRLDQRVEAFLDRLERAGQEPATEPG